MPDGVRDSTPAPNQGATPPHEETLPLRLDDDFLSSVGLGSLPRSLREPFLAQVMETLERRVGERLAARLSSKQLEEFEVLFDNGDEAAATEWLGRNAPTYKAVVAAELDLLKKEISNAAPEILDDVRQAS